MDIDLYFTFVFVLVVIYIALGNYLYFRKVIPEIQKNDPAVYASILPTVQMRQVEEFVKSLSNEEQKPWFYHYLRNLMVISVTLMLLMLPLFFFVITGRVQ